MMEEARQALLKSARENFTGGYVDLTMSSNPFADKEAVEVIANQIFDAINNVVKVLAETR